MATTARKNSEPVHPAKNAVITRNPDGTWKIDGIVMDADKIVYVESSSGKTQLAVNVNLAGEFGGVARGGSRLLITI